MYLDQRYGNLYYLDFEQVREFVQKVKDQDTYLSELSDTLDKNHPTYQIFKVLALSANQIREGTIDKLLEIINQHANKQGKLERQREYFWFHY
ncbi:TRAG family protein [Bacillus sp. GB_SG_008]|uniref:TRAG family protein n=1 Tax=Bacillus sp. GB_SG_008 TaxID=3454627 RepID=UPI003F838FA2